MEDKVLTEASFSSFEPTLSVREFNEMISDAVAASFPEDKWVKGEVQRLNFHSSGHIYFTLVDSGSRGQSCSIPVSLFKNTLGRIKGNIREILEEDREVRLLVKPDFYAPYGKMSLIVQGVDTAFTIGQIALARRELLEKLDKEGILHANGENELGELVTDIVLVTAFDSAAYHDVTDQLKGSGIGFRVRVINALMQGTTSSDSVTHALRKADELGAEVVMLCRGGGAKSDLSSFDSEMVARTICAMRTPVLTGLGHQIDVSVADIVAHSSVKTPTACAQFVIERVGTAMNALHETAQSFRSGIKARMDDADHRLAYISQRLSDAGLLLDACCVHIKAQKTKIDMAGKSTLILATHKLEMMSDLIRAHDPLRVIERGYSLTYNSHGELVTSLSSVQKGDVLVTRIKDGHVESTVNDLTKTKEN